MTAREWHATIASAPNLAAVGDLIELALADGVTAEELREAQKLAPERSTDSIASL